MRGLGYLLTLCLSITLLQCGTPEPAQQTETIPEPVDPSPVPREFRAAWVATVANINWPSKPGLPVAQQKQEARALLDLLADHNFNAVVFQVRPQADALYDSPLEPWSYFLTGQQGEAPQPYYDPLAFWIDEAHRRGLELHAWLNPYRAHHPTGKEVTNASIVKQKPELVVPLATGYWWMKPTHPQTQSHTTAVVVDLIDRYNLDGIHFDDYFYPYPSYNEGADFPDGDDFRAYQNNGGTLSKDDWRRAAVDTFIHQLYDTIKARKPHVKFGISPFGIWRPGNPPSIQGFDQYAELYADARKWFREGWVDYWTPQLYWPVNQVPQSYPVLLDWWAEQNTMQRHLWPGMSIGRKEGEAAVDETINQIMITRGQISDAPGTVHWSIAPLVNHPTLARELLEGPYQKPALVPASPWLDASPPQPPRVDGVVQGDSLLVTWQPDPGEPVSRWILAYGYAGQSDTYEIRGGNTRMVRLPLFARKAGLPATQPPSPMPPANQVLDALARVSLRAVDRAGNESNRTVVTMPSFTLQQAGPLPTFFRDPPPPTLRGFQTGWSVLTTLKPDVLRNKRWALLTHLDASHGLSPGSYQELAARSESTFSGFVDAGQAGLGADEAYRNLDAALSRSVDMIVIHLQLDGSAWDPNLDVLYRTLRWCSQQGISVVVVDRPNPLGAQRVEGPMLPRPMDVGGPLPVRYGLTVAELSQYWNARHQLGVAMRTLNMQAYTRNMTWTKTGLHWQSGRIDLPGPDHVLAQPGMRLLTFAGYRAGMEVQRPYLAFSLPAASGQPDGRPSLLENIDPAVLEMVDLDVLRMADAGKNGQQWVVRLSPKEPEAFQSVRLAAYLLDGLYRTYPNQFNWFTTGLQPAPGTPGLSAMGVWEAWQGQVSDFRVQQGYYHLYEGQ